MILIESNRLKGSQHLRYGDFCHSRVRGSLGAEPAYETEPNLLRGFFYERHTAGESWDRVHACDSRQHAEKVLHLIILSYTGYYYTGVLCCVLVTSINK